MSALFSVRAPAVTCWKPAVRSTRGWDRVPVRAPRPFMSPPISTGPAANGPRAFQSSASRSRPAVSIRPLAPAPAGRAGQFAALDLDPPAVSRPASCRRGLLPSSRSNSSMPMVRLRPRPSKFRTHGAPARADEGPDRSAEGAARVRQHAPGVRQLRLSTEAHSAQQIARAGAVQRQPLPLQIDCLQQDGAVLHPRRLHLHAGRRAQQAADDAFARSAVGANVAVQVHPAVLDRQVQRPGDPRGAIAGHIGVQQGHGAVQAPVLGVALEQAGIGGRPCHIRSDQSAQRCGLDVQLDAVRRTAVGVADQAARLGLHIVGNQFPGHALAGLVGRRDHGEAEAGGAADLGHEGRQQVRTAEVGEARDARSLVAEMPLDDQGNEPARLDAGVDHVCVQHRRRGRRAGRANSPAHRPAARPGPRWRAGSGACPQACRRNWPPDAGSRRAGSDCRRSPSRSWRRCAAGWRRPTGSSGRIPWKSLPSVRCWRRTCRCGPRSAEGRTVRWSAAPPPGGAARGWSRP